jgi:hypothetical protein
MINPDDGVWVATAPDEDDTYFVTLSLDADHIVRLDDETLGQWVAHVTTAATAAEHDMIVMTMLTKQAGVTKEAAAAVVVGARDIRQLPPSPLEELRLEPGVSAFTGKAFLRLHSGDRAIGSWELQDAQDHVYGVLSARASTILDSAVLASMKAIGLPRNTAINFVSAMGEFNKHGDTRP